MTRQERDKKGQRRDHYSFFPSHHFSVEFSNQRVRPRALLSSDEEETYALAQTAFSSHFDQPTQLLHASTNQATKMDHGSMSGMDMGSSSSMSGMDMSEGGCKISMIWNWNVVDACFISKQWRIRSTGDYVGSLIGIFFIVVTLEVVRRIGRDYDRKIRASYYRRETAALAAVASSSKVTLPESALVPAPFRPSYAQQMIRSCFYGISFGTAYLLMLLAMSYNGGVILSIFAGGAVGHFISARDTATIQEVETVDDSPQARGECCC